MQPSCDPLRSWDRGRSKRFAKHSRCAHKGYRHPFFLHNAALGSPPPPHIADSVGILPNGGAPVFVTSELSAPGEGRSRLARVNLPEYGTSPIMLPPSTSGGLTDTPRSRTLRR